MRVHVASRTLPCTGTQKEQKFVRLAINLVELTQRLGLCSGLDARPPTPASLFNFTMDVHSHFANPKRGMVNRVTQTLLRFNGARARRAGPLHQESVSRRRA